MEPKLASTKECTGCGACYAICPKNAITLKHNKNGFISPSINKNICIECSLCEKTCPILHHERFELKSAKNIKNYSGWTTDDQLALKTTSGGIFAQIAIEFLKEKQSIVYGAHLTPSNQCNHIGIQSAEDITKIIGTKYIQSNTGNAYKEIKQYLKKGFRVLYSGTPCQVAGLYSYLGRKIENLYTIDLICAGVPSKIISDVATKYYNASYIISYRDKSKGWCFPKLQRKCFGCTYSKTDGEIIKPQNDVFYKCFGLSHRQSCYICQFAQPNRTGDLSLGDQWGLSEKLPSRSYKGASLICSNSLKGEELLQKTANIFLIKNENGTLNAPPLFIPHNVGKAYFSDFLWLIKKLPVKYAINILTKNYKKNWLLLPFTIYFLTMEKKYKKRLQEKIIQIKKENW